MAYIAFLAVLTAAGTLEAAPKLRLSSATVGPVSIAQGANGILQTVEASNGGDGNLSLQLASSVSWITTAIGGSRPCFDRPGACLPISINLQTSALARGIYTGRVTVSDSNALDAPQSITVTVQIGGGVPEQANLFVAPNGSSDEVRFITNSQLSSSATTQSGGPWLSIGLDGSGSFRFVMPYRISARHLEGMAEGTYTGSVAVSGSPVAGENRTVPISLQVTSRPILGAAPAELAFRVAQGVSPQQSFVGLSNRGMGALGVSGISASTSSGGGWLGAAVNPAGNLVTVSVDTGSTGPGLYRGTVTVNSNAANGSVAIPVALEVVAQGPPLAAFGGVLNTGSFDNGLAQGGTAAVFGEQLSFQPAAQGAQIPLVRELNGVRVLVNDQAAPLYFTSYNQVNFQIPFETPAGEAIIRVERQGQRGNPVAVEIASRAPRIIQAGDSGVIVNPDGSLAIRGGRAARPGEALTIYCVGFGATGPATATGAGAPAAEPLARITPAPRVILGSAFSGAIALEPLYAGLTPSLVGLYQVNVILPSDTPLGDVPLFVEGDGYRSNTVILPVSPE
jgi:uncharacterized protein (TIGR03437 family)